MGFLAAPDARRRQRKADARRRARGVGDDSVIEMCAIERSGS